MQNDSLTGRMLTTGEASRILHVHENTLRRWNNVGLITAYRIGPRGDRRFLERELRYFLSTSDIYAGNGKSN